MNLRTRILELFKRLPGEGITRSRAAAELGLGKYERKELKELLDRLTNSGLLHRRRSRYYFKETAEGCEGVFHAARQGFGFVTPDPAASEGLSGDVFIPARDTGGALEGDRVDILIVSRTGRRGRGPEGCVKRVLSRRRAPVIGLVRDGLLYPMGGGGSPVRLPRDFGFEGRVAAAWLADKEGPPAAERAEDLGEFSDPATPIRAAETRYGFTHEFPAEAAGESRRLPDEPDPAEFAGREDYRSLTTVTIDPEDARDFDDGFSIERSQAGWKLWIHIADVSHYVRPGTAMDEEAYRRGNTTYFPGTAYHMLPEKLSAGLCSLLPGRDRLSFSTELLLDREGKVVSARFARGVIHSTRRLSYEQAQAVLDGKEKAEPAVARLLKEAAKVGKLLQKRRIARGSLDLDLPETDLLFGTSGLVEEVVPVRRLETHHIIEEFMLLANTAVAQALYSAGTPTLYRIHEEPDEEKLEALRPLLNSLGLGAVASGVLADPFRLQKVLEKASGHRAEKLVSYLVLRSMMQARYSPVSVGHFGLALERYCHFTSPIRRYPDLIVHRSLAGLVSGRGAPERDLEAAGLHCSSKERVSESAEREVVAWFQNAYLSTRLGESFEALVLGFTRFGIRVELLDNLVEGICPFFMIEQDHIRVTRDGLQARGRYSGAVLKVGEILPVTLVRVDLLAGEPQFTPDAWPGRGRSSRKTHYNKRRKRRG